MIAMPSAPPSTGSVPEPTSSSSTSAGSTRLRSMAAMLVTCQEKVLRLAAIDCSSPMSANTDWNTGRREPSATGMCSPAWAIKASSPAVLIATVLPPVFGPVITRTDVGGISLTSTGTGPSSRAVWRSPSARGTRASTAGINSGCRAASSSTWPSSRSSGAMPSHRRANRALACTTSSSAATSSVRCRSSARDRNLSVRSRRMRWTSSASCSSRATTSLLISTVLRGSRNKLAPLDELPCTMPGMAVRFSARTRST